MATPVYSGNGRSSGRGAAGRYRPMSEINVTPLVDVMLVLLVVFMVTAPLLTVGVPVELPQTQASAIVIGLPYRKRFGEYEIGETATYILKNAPCRVWLARQPMPA